MVYTLGEMLLDVITEKEIPRTEYFRYGHAGGAMLNAAVSLARSHIKTALISETGDDAIAAFLIRFLKENHVNTAYVIQYPNTASSVALARLDRNKKPVYSFRKSYPDKRSLLSPQHFNPSDILLFGSLYSLDPVIRCEINKILRAASVSGALILYDPNIRKAEQLWQGNRRNALMENLQKASVIKGSDEDFDAVFGPQPPEKHIGTLQNINPEAVIFITLGARGALAAWKNRIIRKPASKIKVVSTIGAGDGFNAGVIAKIEREKWRPTDLPDHLEACLDSGIAFSAAVCSSKDNYIPHNRF